MIANISVLAAFADLSGAVGPFLLSALKFIFIVFEVLLIFNLLIFVHELGHFLAAKWRKLYVEEFALWFGKPLWRRKIGGVWYAINSIPAGGYVKLPQMAPMESLEGHSEIPKEALQPISPLDKIIVAFAGPLFSFLLAGVFAVIVWGAGRPVTEGETTTTIGYVDSDPNSPPEESPAAAVGLKPGDRIIEVDGAPVHRWGGIGSDSVTWRIYRSEGETIPIKFERNVDGKLVVNTVNPKPIVPETGAWSRTGLRMIKIAPAEAPVVGEIVQKGPAESTGLQPKDAIVAINGERIYSFYGLSEYIANHPQEPMRFTVERGDKLEDRKTVETGPLTTNAIVIRGVTEGGPAEAAGLVAGDRVVAINGQPVPPSRKLTELVRGGNGAPVNLTIQHKDETRAVTLKPQYVASEKRHMIGVEWEDDLGLLFSPRARVTYMYPGPVEQLRKSARSIFDTIGAIASKSSVRIQHMGGPVMMMRAYYSFFSMDFIDGWRMALWFSVVLNVNLAMLNMLPFPVLDGGHIVLAILEGVRRRPMNVRVLEWLQTACAVLIIGFMLYIVFFDVGDWFTGKSKLKFQKSQATPAETNK